MGDTSSMTTKTKIILLAGYFMMNSGYSMPDVGAEQTVEQVMRRPSVVARVHAQFARGDSTDKILEKSGKSCAMTRSPSDLLRERQQGDVARARQESE